MYLSIIRDAAAGALFAGIFSYNASLYSTNQNYLKLTAFLWGVPLLYFYILFIAFNIAGKEAAYDVSTHGLLGISITLFAIILTILIMKIDNNLIIGINIFILTTAIFIYTYFGLYNISFPSIRFGKTKIE